MYDHKSVIDFCEVMVASAIQSRVYCNDVKEYLNMIFQIPERILILFQLIGFYWLYKQTSYCLGLWLKTQLTCLTLDIHLTRQWSYSWVLCNIDLGNINEGFSFMLNPKLLGFFLMVIFTRKWYLHFKFCLLKTWKWRLCSSSPNMTDILHFYSDSFLVKIQNNNRSHVFTGVVQWTDHVSSILSIGIYRDMCYLSSCFRFFM